MTEQSLQVMVSTISASIFRDLCNLPHQHTLAKAFLAGFLRDFALAHALLSVLTLSQGSVAHWCIGPSRSGPIDAGGQRCDPGDLREAQLPEHLAA
jgi:hypothetical protein